MTNMTPAPKTVNDVRCYACKATPGEPCHTPSGHPANEPHADRVALFWKRQG